MTRTENLARLATALAEAAQAARELLEAEGKKIKGTRLKDEPGEISELDRARAVQALRRAGYK